MELTIEIPEKVVERAAELGVPVTTLVSRALDEMVEKPLPEGFALLRGPGKPRMTAQEAAQGIREIARTHSLGGLRSRI